MMRMRNVRRSATVGLAIASVALLTACGTSGGSGLSPTTAARAALGVRAFMNAALGVRAFLAAGFSAA